MTKRLLIDASHAEETRVVVLDGNRLEDFDVETATRKQIKGNIYLAKVIRVEPSLQAAFVEYGGNRHGFLAFGEIHPDYYQIPVADRQRLLKLQAEEEAEDARDEEEPDAKAARPLAVTPVEILAAAPPEDDGAEPSGDDGVEPSGDDGGEPSGDDRGEAQPGGDGVEAGDGLFFEAAGDAPAGDPLPDDATAGSTPAGEGEAVDEGDLAVSAPDRHEMGEPEQVPEAPPPESFGGDGDDAAEARERRQRQRFLRNYKIQEVIHRRQIMLIQVVKEERGNKGAALTTYLSLAGRFSVLMPNSPSGGGVSRKITSPADRRRLKEAMAELDVPEGMGLIVRTAGANRPKPEIVRDCEYLLRLWDDIRERTLQSTAPALIYEEASLIKRTIRDVYTRDVEDVLVDGEEGWRAARDFMRMLMPAHARKVQLWSEGFPLFAKFQVEAQLDAMLNPIVQLRSGGYIVINQTEALVAIDVNSGRSTRERSIEDTALRTNLEAAEEVARQVRMRDLAGLIVIDFIDMESRKNNAAVERRMKDALRNDRARIQVGSISHFGLMEMSRQRLRPSLAEASLVTCPHCAGMGHVRSPESAALHILRAIEDEGAKLRAAEIAVVLPPEIALYLFNHKRDRLSAIEVRYGMRVIFTGDATLAGANFRIEKIRAQTASALPAPASYAGAGPVAARERAPVVEDAAEAEAEEEAEMDAAAPGAGAPVPAGETAEEGERRRRRRRRRRPGRRDGAEPGGEDDARLREHDDEGRGNDVAAAGLDEQPGAGEQPVVAAEEPVSELDAALAAQLNELGEPGVAEPARRRRSRGGRRRRGGEDAPAAEPVETVYADVAELFEAAERAEAALRMKPRPQVQEAEPAADDGSGGGEEDPRLRGDDGVAVLVEPAEGEPEVEPGVADAGPVAAEPGAPVWAPKVISPDEPVAEKKRGWWRR
jgi:ribonuclease E